VYEGTKAYTKFFSSQLSDDIQAMVKNAFFTVAKVSD
jgi:hypothetical protein